MVNKKSWLTQLENKNVLVVDDDRHNLNLLTQLLYGLGMRVIPARDGAEALQKFSQYDFDLLITDLNMPGLSGNGLLTELRRRAEEICPVIAVTGSPDMAIEGFDQILQKPFKVPHLVETVRKAINGPEKPVWD